MIRAAFLLSFLISDPDIWTARNALCARARGDGTVMITAEDVDEAALALAVAARELLGLPIERHVTAAAAGGGRQAPPFIAYAPPVLHEAPSALDFARRLASPSPCIIHNALQDRPKVQQWKQPGYLTSTMGDRPVKVAVTPDGRADDLKTLSDGKTVFALPAESHMWVDKSRSGW